jgi:hypothetical protein
MDQFFSETMVTFRYIEQAKKNKNKHKNNMNPKDFFLLQF